MNTVTQYQTLFKCLLASFPASLKTPLGPCHTLCTTNTHAQWKFLMFDWCPASQLDVIDTLYPSPRLSGAQFAIAFSVSTPFFMRRVRVTVTKPPFCFSPRPSRWRSMNQGFKVGWGLHLHMHVCSCQTLTSLWSG